MIQFLIHWMPLLDAAAKIVAIFGVIGLGFAYCQYRHSVRIAERNERRAAVELAAKECAHYGSELIFKQNELVKKINDSGCKYIEHCKLVKENGKDRQKLLIDSSAVTDEDRQKMKEYVAESVCLLNKLEGFAIPFACGVADDRVGFMECGRSFVSQFEKYFALYSVTNLQQYYKSSQTLYWRWRKQIEKEELERQHAQAGEKFFSLSEKLIKGESNSWFARKVAAVLHDLANRFSKSK